MKPKQHVWFIEDSSPSSTNNEDDNNNNSKRKKWTVLTKQGVENIAKHQYKPGQYTHLDNLFSPFWEYLTSHLPTWLAPNVITTLGGIHPLSTYFLTWYYSPNFDNPNLSSYLIFYSGYCLIVYYTLDCMDGKQARRIGASSPLGQLFDHGVDCLCNMAHVSSASMYLVNGGGMLFLVSQCCLQFMFFMAQWEEYQTGVLPTSAGRFFGATELIYGMGLFTILNSLIDRKSLWNRTMDTLLPNLPDPISQMELRKFGVIIWAILMTFLCLQSAIRVYFFFRQNSSSSTKPPPLITTLRALSQLISPFLVSLSSFILPSVFIQQNTRCVSIAMGLQLCLVSIKMIVFGMAKMSFASIQLDCWLYVLCMVMIRVGYNGGMLDQRGGDLILSIMCWFYLMRLLIWCRLAIGQICARLDIHCFRVKEKKKKDE